ncbi:MAG: PAS domain S-box protein [Syntrophobacteraceae bacterium]|nr:PAS domain S-box protein [Syntrophobacteraceae bacterium]
MHKVPRWLTAMFVLALMGLATGGAWFYRAQERSVRARVEANLEAVAKLKVEEIAQWRLERLADATELMKSPFLSKAVTQWLANPQAGAGDVILERFRSHPGYSDILLVDANGQVRLSLSGRSGTLDGEAAHCVTTAFREGRPVLTDLSVSSAQPLPHMEAVTPIFAAQSERSHPVAAILLQSTAKDSLYEITGNWPVPTTSAESLLVRRDGDSVLFLNDLRYRPHTALKLHIPLNRADVPAVMAVKGKEGVVEGRDYRGVEVLSVLEAIPYSPWFLVAKMDKAEVLADWRSRSLLILALTLGLAMGTLAAGGMVYQRFAKEHYRSLFRSEAARRESEAKYRTTLMSIGDAVIVTDIEGGVRVLNPVAETLTGWRQEEACGKPFAEVFPILNEQTRQPAKDPVASVLRDGAIVGLANHTVLISRDGREFAIADSAAPILDETGKVNGVVVVFRDQTSERRAEKELQRSNENYRLLVRNIPGVVFRGYGDGGAEFFDDKIRFLTGYPVEDFASRKLKWTRLIHPEDLSHAEESFLRALREGRECIREYRLKRSDGEYVWLQERTQIICQEDGRLDYVSGIMFDITERKLTERSLEDTETKIRGILDNIGIGVALLSPGMEVLEMNRQMHQWFPAVEPAKHPICYRAFNDPPGEAVCHNCPACKTLRDGLPHEETTQIVRDGRVRNYRIVSSPIPGPSGKITAVIEMVDDITEKLSLEAQFRQAQRMEAVGRLAGGVAHDFNNMLGIILGYTEMALSKLSPDNPLFANLQEIMKAAQRSADLTRQLLAFARKQTVAPRVLDLNETVEGMLKILRRLIGENIDLTWLPGKNLWPVKMDPSQIDQVLANLCVNARDAITDNGMVTIETKNVFFDHISPVEPVGFVPGEYLLLAVSDDGCGMDRGTLDKIFEPFFTTKDVGKGTGLGLSTVYGIVKQNNGFINVYSEPGQGTTFKIYLPRHEGRTVEPLATSGAEVPTGHGETILLVEDESAILDMAADMLQGLGYNVLALSTPGEAINFAVEHADKIGLLITDVVMPEMSGLDLARNIRSLQPGLKVLFVSGYTYDVIAHHGVLESGIRFLQKPFSTRDLAVKVREAIEGV